MKNQFLSATVVALLLIASSAALFQGFSQSEASPTHNNLLKYEWPQMQGDSSFTRFSAGPAPNAPDILWKTDVPSIQPYISAFNGMIFVTTKTTVYALDPELGTIIWNTPVPESGPWPAVYKIDATHMVVGSSCLAPSTGSIIWTSSDFSATPTPLFAYNVYSPEEKMFYTKVNSFVHGWNFSDPSKPPTLSWSTYVSGGGSDGSGVQYGDGKVFPGSFDSHQMALDAKTGAVLWDTNTKAAMLFSGTYSDGKFFRGGAHDNTFYAFDANTGKILWTFDPDTEDGYWCSGTAVAYGMVYGLNKDGNLYALDVNTGDVVWQYPGPGSLMFPGTPTVADGKIYATTGQEEAFSGERSQSEFACLDAYTGQLIWKLSIEAFAPRESVAIAYGNLYLIPADVTTAVDSISGAEYSTIHQVWAIGTRDWSMYRHDSAHTGVGQSGPANLCLRWAFTTGGAVVSSPTLVDGRAYFGSQDKNIYCVNAGDGSFIWKFTTLSGAKASPAVVNGKVYTGTDDGYVYCLDAYNGSLIWKTFAGGDLPAFFNAAVNLRSSPIVVRDRVYVGALDNKTYALDANTGRIAWTYQTEGYITSSPAVVDGGVYIISQEPAAGALYKLDADTGILIWKLEIPYEWTLGGGTDLHASPTVADGMVFASSNCVAYYGVNATTGNIIWTYRDEAARGFIVCSTIYEGGELFLVDHFSIVCVDAKNGSALWESFLGDELYVSPTYADNKLYVVTDQRHLYVLNATDGEKLGFVGMHSNSWSSPTTYEGKVYVGSNDWAVYCFAYTPALTSSITLGLATAAVVSGEVVTGFGQLVPGISDATVTLSFVKPDGSVNSMQVATSAKGVFTFTFTPSATGTWAVKAQWMSDKNYYVSATSPTVVLTVNSAQSPLPFDEQEVAGIPTVYVYTVFILFLFAVITVVAYVYRKRTHH